MILDDLKPGDWVLIERCTDQDEMREPNGMPLKVCGVSLPWLAVMPADRPGMVVGINLNRFKISMPSDEYVNAFLAPEMAGWQSYIADQNRMIQGSAGGSPTQSANQESSSPCREQTPSNCPPPS